MQREHVFNNRYRLDQRLGDGGMAVVYAGTDLLLRRRVAIKVLRDQFAADEDFVRRFYNEAQSAARLSHPNIVNTYDVGREEQTYYIVMELVEGTTLAEVIRTGDKVPESVAIDYSAQMCNGLAYAHRQGLLHRDIKPANILITHDDVVKLSDFGIARALTQQTIAVTQPGMVMGSVYYISPEQAQGLELRETSDLYSVGIVLYQMLAGKLPYTGDSPVTVALKHVSEPPPTLASTDASPALAAIVERLLQKDPHDRFQSAGEVATALREARERPMVAAAAVSSGSMRGSSSSAPMRPPPRRAATEGDGSGPNGAGAHVSGERERRGSTARTSIALLVALLIAIAGGYALWGNALPLMSGVVLSDEGGRNAIDAQRDLESKGLHVKLEGVPSDSVPQDQVVREDPAAGTRLQSGTEVTLYVSTGVAPKPLVSVNDFTLSDAQKTMDREGLRTKIVQKYSAEKPSGTVIATSPKAGELVKPGSLVVLDVSKGAPPLKLADFVGHPLADAQAALAKAKVNVNVQRVALDGVPPDQVTSEDPAAGTLVTEGSTVTLTVSTGPALVGVPNVGGQSLTDATNALSAAGLVAKVTYSIQTGGDGTVVQQDPAPTATAPRGSPVSIMVAVPGTVPSVAGLSIDGAQAALARYGYKAGTITYVQEGPAGTVSRTNPPANSPLDVGEAVNLFVNGTPPPR